LEVVVEDWEEEIQWLREVVTKLSTTNDENLKKSEARLARMEAKMKASKSSSASFGRNQN
jgi:hypothetical protein